MYILLDHCPLIIVAIKILSHSFLDHSKYAPTQRLNSGINYYTGTRYLMSAPTELYIMTSVLFRGGWTGGHVTRSHFAKLCSFAI